ncbi:unnamed protein product, partial [Mesorhabditis spiculigera]
MDSMLAAFESSDEEENVGPETSAKTSKPKNGGLRMVPLDFTSQEPEEDLSTPVKSFDSDSENDDDEMIERKPLSAAGLGVKKLLRKEEDKRRDKDSGQSIHQLAQKLAPAKETAKLGLPSAPTAIRAKAVAYDAFFKFNIRTPKIASDIFDSLCEGMKKIRLSTLTKSNVPTDMDGFITMGVLIERSDVRKSANGNQFMIWKLHDLLDCQKDPVKVLLFGEAFKTHHKHMTGNVVCLVNPQVAEQNEKEKLLVFKAVRPAQIVEIGWSADLGKCRGVKADGGTCQNFVNISASEYCVYHVMSQAKKLSANRGTFNALSSSQPVQRKPSTPGAGMFSQPGLGFRGHAFAPPRQSPSQLHSQPSRPFSRVEEKKNLMNIVSARSQLLGAKNLMMARQARDPKFPGSAASSPTVVGSITEFLKQRAAEILRLNGNVGPRKRAAGDSPSTSAKRAHHEDEATSPGPSSAAIDALMNRKSKFAGAADKAESEAIDRYMTTMEAREKVETFVTTTMSVKEVAVVSCKICHYTAQSQSELCKGSGHEVQRHKAEKRFFKCKECKQRTVAFGMLPTGDCARCGATNWERVAMRDERKTALDREKLLLRGEERKYVNI